MKTKKAEEYIARNFRNARGSSQEIARKALIFLQEGGAWDEDRLPQEELLELEKQLRQLSK